MFIQVEIVSTKYYSINRETVPTVYPSFPWFGGNDGGNEAYSFHIQRLCVEFINMMFMLSARIDCLL